MSANIEGSIMLNRILLLAFALAVAVAPYAEALAAFKHN